MKYCTALVLSYQLIFVFYSSLTFPHDLYWPTKFEMLSDQTINSPYIYAPNNEQANLNHVETMRSLGRAVKLNL